MSRQPIETFHFTDGFNGAQSASEGSHRILASGSANQIITGSGKVQAFKGLSVIASKQGSLWMTNAGEGYAGLGSYGDAGDVKGSVWRMLTALLFIGNGALRFNGNSLAANASSILQLKLLQNGVYSGTTYQAGLSQPDAPLLATLPALGAGFSGRLKNGTYSAKLIKIRAATGVRSLASPMSNIIVASESAGVGQSARITFPLIGANGADRWGIYVSPRNFGSTGNHYLLREVNESELVTVVGVARSLEIEWTDGDLVGQPLAPIDSFPPPAGVFGGALGDVAFLDGCYGDVTNGVSSGAPGATIVQSLPLRPEEYPPDWTLFPPEPPTALLRGGDGFYYRFGKSSMGVISNVGGEPPLNFQLLWATTGISYPHNAVVGTGGRIYAKCGKRGFVRIGADGEPETEWATPVSDIVAAWDDAKTILGWDGSSHSLVAMNGSTMLVYNESLDKWGAPINLNLPGDAVAAVTFANNIIIAAKDNAASDIKLYSYNVGTGSLMTTVSDWHFSSEVTDMLRTISVLMRADNTANNVLLDVFAEGDLTAPRLSLSLPVRKTGVVRLQTERFVLPNLHSFCVRLRQQTTGGDAGFEKIEVSGTARRIES